MLFAYLNLPPIPQELVDGCFENIKLINQHPMLEPINSVRERVIRATFLTKDLKTWLRSNISNKFNPNLPEFTGLFNITTYHNDHKNPEDWGSQMIHYDRGRTYAINFYVDTGGSDVKTSWYENDKTTKVAETVIQPFRWAVLRVNPRLHGVKGIEPGRKRMFISCDVLTDVIDNFDETTFFKDVVVEDSILRAHPL